MRIAKVVSLLMLLLVGVVLCIWNLHDAMYYKNPKGIFINKNLSVALGTMITMCDIIAAILKECGIFQ